MKTIAIRFSDIFAPNNDTIAAHQAVIDKFGYVWFGRLGNHKMSQKVINEVMSNGQTYILMIHTQSKVHYLARVESICEECPEPSKVPSYYRDNLRDFSNWLKISEFIPEGEEILKQFITSSGNTIFDIYKKSMGSYFVVERKGD